MDRRSPMAFASKPLYPTGSPAAQKTQKGPIRAPGAANPKQPPQAYPGVHVLTGTPSLDAVRLAPYLAPRVGRALQPSCREEGSAMDLYDLTCEELDQRVSFIKELASQAAQTATTEQERQGVQDVVELVEEVLNEATAALDEHIEALRAINRAFTQPRS
jgi:hypothetical protein